MLGNLFGKFDDTLFGSYVTLDGDDFASHLTLFGGGIEFLGCGFEDVLSSTVDDDLELSIRYDVGCSKKVMGWWVDSEMIPQKEGSTA